ncbi:hypothetical protein ACH5RR_027309 [Cinchona calisaya]|uniref:ATP-dependent DNA helicase n=1 Tax=Cinchona calisaya TaxID=153742 RepID=A0ABD2Z8Z7_9GENT
MTLHSARGQKLFIVTAQDATIMLLRRRFQMIMPGFQVRLLSLHAKWIARVFIDETCLMISEKAPFSDEKIILPEPVKGWDLRQIWSRVTCTVSIKLNNGS